MKKILSLQQLKKTSGTRSKSSMSLNCRMSSNNSWFFC
ncbi:class III lanthipeptide [Streptococcus sanguinis]